MKQHRAATGEAGGMRVPRSPVAMIDLSVDAATVTARGARIPVASHRDATRLVGRMAATVGRPVRVWLRQADGGLQLAAVDVHGDYIDPDGLVLPVDGSPIPKEALNGHRPLVVQQPVPPRAARPAGLSEEELGVFGRPVPSRRTWRWRGAAAQPRVETVDPLRQVESMTYLVANPKGAAGKTMLSVLLAQAVATVRARDVVVLDLNPTGNLALRAGTPTGAGTIGEMAQRLEALRRPPYDAELYRGVPLLEPGSWRAVPAAGSVVGRGAGLLGRDQLERILDSMALSTHVVGMDSGNDYSAPVWQAAAARADVLVVPVKLTPDTCQAAARMLADLQVLGHGDLVARRTLVVATRGPGSTLPREQLATYRTFFTDRGWPVIDLPADPHLGRRAAIQWDWLKPATRTAALGLARAVAEVSLRRRVLGVSA